LFVYGTLRDAARLADIVGDGVGFSYLGQATVNGDLYDAGEYPALLLRPEGGRVEGLLVQLDDSEASLAALDSYEEVGGGLFVRRRCCARLTDGSERVAWVYEYNRSVQGQPRLDENSG
jgi:gamma-glutamylcyclotransferase (GGCT)/AIG2-like uncharacterized protein YtfP